MKTRTWILLFGVLFLVCAALTLFFNLRGTANYAEIYSGGKLVRTVCLSQDMEFTVEYGGGFNTVRVQDGKICVTQASCPDGLCKRFGAKNGGLPIICLPNQLEIRFTNRGGVDAAVG